MPNRRSASVHRHAKMYALSGLTETRQHCAGALACPGSPWRGTCRGDEGRGRVWGKHKLVVRPVNAESPATDVVERLCSILGARRIAGGSRAAPPKRPVKNFRVVSLHVVACIHRHLVAAMFKAPLPATRVIARRLYSSRGESSPFCSHIFCYVYSRVTSDTIPLQLHEEFGQVPSHLSSSAALQDSWSQPECVLSVLLSYPADLLYQSLPVGMLSLPPPSSRVRSLT